MQIMIDIPEEDYKNVNRIVDIGLGTNVDKAIKNGTPLPKHHGRLIDADALQMEMEKDVRKAMSFVDLTDFVWIAPTIIEAEAEE